MDPAAAAAGALGFVLLASGGVVELAREEGVRLVDEYCAYGAVSDARAGPFCAAAVERRESDVD